MDIMTLMNVYSIGQCFPLPSFPLSDAFSFFFEWMLILAGTYVNSNLFGCRGGAF